MLTTGFIWALTAAMGAVIWLDITRYLIPNLLNLALLLLWVAGAFLLPVDVLWALAAAGLMLLVGLALFGMGLMGGGDIKLLVVLTLWTGWSAATGQFLMLTAIIGGVLVMVMLVLRALGQAVAKGRNLPRFLMPKQPVPYGLAIAGAFMVLLWRGAVPPLS